MIGNHGAGSRGRALAIAVGGVLAASGVSAQQAGSTDGAGRIEEVIVTAQRREQSAQAVPVTVSAFSAEDVQVRNLTQAVDISQYIPNMFGSNNIGLGAANTYFIRGLGTTESLATQDPPVATYVNEIYLARTSSNNIALFDVQRIEVLRGPQGTLFGRNTTGGAIHVVLQEPHDEREGFLEAGIGSYSNRELRGGVNLPLSARVRGRLAGYLTDTEGYAKNVTTGERVNHRRAHGLRGSLGVDFTDTVSWQASAIHTSDESSNLVNFRCNPRDPNDCSGRFVSTGLVRNNGG